MNPINANFMELYRRHLCRHSEFGINVLHLIAVVGVYFSLYGIAFSIPGGRWIVAGVLSIYFAVIAKNVPFPLWIANTTVVLLILGMFLAIPTLHVLVHVALLFAWHRFQNWNHKIYHKEHPMDEFKGKYQKGPKLFFLLSVYELPILLNYLLFDRKHQAASTEA